MSKVSKRMKKIREGVESDKIYTLEDAVALLQKTPDLKFDETIDIAIQTGIDPKKSDQQIRGTVRLPHGSGQTLKVAALCKGASAQEAQQAGAEIVGAEELIEKIAGGWLEFDVLVTTPDMMREVGKLGKVLGPRGLMPTPKAGTVSKDIGKAIAEIKGGKVEFKVDKSAVIHGIIGKKSFAKEKLVENANALIQAIQRAKPVTAKGIYLKALHLSSTMGPGLKVQIAQE